MQNSNEKSKCCEKCLGSISGLQWWCNDASCPCHKPSVEVSKCCKKCGKEVMRLDGKHQIRCEDLFCKFCHNPERQSIPLDRDERECIQDYKEQMAIIEDLPPQTESEECGFGCGRKWDEEGDENGFSNCVSAYHLKGKIESEEWENEIDIEFNIDMLKANVKEIIRKALDSHSQKLVSELKSKIEELLKTPEYNKDQTYDIAIKEVLNIINNSN